MNKKISNYRKAKGRTCYTGSICAGADRTCPGIILQPAPQQQLQAASAAEKPKQQAETSADNFVTIKSPMIGTFYRRSAPDKPAFAEVGDDVTPGKIVCIIEAMKLFNEIESEVSGKIVKVLVEDASPVEYDQPLFLVEPAIDKFNLNENVDSNFGIFNLLIFKLYISVQKNSHCQPWRDCFKGYSYLS